MRTRPLRIAKLGVLGLMLILLVGAWHFDLAARLGDPEELADSLAERGVWGYLAFIGVYMLLKPLGVPGTLFVVSAPLIWPWKTAFAVSMVGTMGATVISFAFARFVARDWVSHNIPARLRKFEQALDEKSFKAVVILRLIFWMPQTLHFFFGVSRVGFWTHFWGSVVGYIPPLLLLTYLGSEMVDASGKLQPAALPFIAALVLAALAIAAIARSRVSLASATQGDTKV